jgi:hypothetical protein
MPKKVSKFPPKKPDNSHLIKHNPKRNWSELQKDIFRDIAKGTGHTVVIARAGSGKTSTIVEGFKYIPKGKKTLMVAFNKSIADELRQRAPSYVDTLTLHSLGFRAIKQTFGAGVILENDKCTEIVKTLIGDSRDDWELNQSICKCVSLCKGFLVDTPSRIGDLIDRFGIEIFDLTREKFIEHVIKALGLCKANKQIIDFDDMIWFPFVYRLNVGKFDVVFVDEAQDLNAAQIAMVLSANKMDGRIIAVGDPAQCVDKNTVVSVSDGTTKCVEDVNIGDSILCYNNGKNQFKKVLKKTYSCWMHGVQITTESGKRLLMSPDHKIWASNVKLDNQYIVYLMYRKDLGFRVGKTNKWRDSQNPFGRRTLSENADRLWVLDIVSSNEEALFLEQKYSLMCGIPTSVYNAVSRNINQNRINNIFWCFGLNGQKLLDIKGFKFDLPHWIASSFTNLNKSRQTIRLNAHSKKGTQVSLEWKDSKITDLLSRHKVIFTSGTKNNFRIRRFFSHHFEAVQFAKQLQNIIGAHINERLSFDRDMLYLLNAASLHKGMEIISLVNGEAVKDKIVAINDHEPGVFIDLEIEDANNFFGNDILSHNSIYQFRGADSEAIPNFITKLSAKTLPLSVSYRCPEKIIKVAQEIVPDIEAAPHAPDGIVEEVQVEELLKLVRPGDFVLSRTNAPLIKHCLKLLRAGVPANIQGRDIGSNLQYFIKKSKSKTINSFIEYVNEWRAIEVKRLMSEKKDTTIAIDKAECLLNLCEGTLTIKDLKETIDSLFSDVSDSAKVVFSTTHKAKGLERDRVFVLANTYRKGAGGEEDNLWYVAVTRAKAELYIVKKPSKWEQYDDAPKEA